MNKVGDARRQRARPPTLLSRDMVGWAGGALKVAGGGGDREARRQRVGGDELRKGRCRACQCPPTHTHTLPPSHPPPPLTAMSKASTLASAASAGAGGAVASSARQRPAPAEKR